MNALIYTCLVFAWPVLFGISYAKLFKKEYLTSIALSLLGGNGIFLIAFFFIKRGTIISHHVYTVDFVLQYFILTMISMIFTFILINSLRKYRRPLLYFTKLNIIFGSILILSIVFTLWNYALMPELTFQQFIYNILVPTALDNADFWADVFPIASYLIVHVVAWVYLMWHTRNRVKENVNNIKVLRIVNGIVLVLSLVVSLAFPTYYFQLYKIADYLNFDGHFFRDNYIAPTPDKLIFPKEKNNLVFVFLESYEATFFSEDLGGKSKTNLLPELTPYMSKGDWFSNKDGFGGGIPLSGMGWSIAGQVSYLSGVPLLLPFTHGNEYGYDGVFLPGLETLGDLLEHQGYRQHLLMGSDKKFAGTDSFFSSHGNHTITDLTSKRKDGSLPENYHVGFGIEDRTLFKYAREEIAQMAKRPEPFSYVMLTGDTHFPNGYATDDCDCKASMEYERSIQCSDREVASFLKWLEEQPFYDKTTVVLVGDHLSMSAEFAKKIDSAYRRTTFNLILNSRADKTKLENKNRMFTTTDFFPTIVASLGVKIKGERLGIGTNLYSGRKTFVEEQGISPFNAELGKTDRSYLDNFMYVKKHIGKP